MSKPVKFQISSPTHSSEILILSSWIVTNLDLPRSTINSNTINKQWNQLQDIQIEVDINFDRCKLPNFHLSQDVQIGNKNEPIAISTPLVWVLVGGKSITNFVRSSFMLKETERLPNIVERFLSLESYGPCQKDHIFVLPLQERIALELF